MPIYCSHCEYRNRLSAGFCGGCGRRLEVLSHCPVCGADSPRSRMYCDRCGAPMDATSVSRTTRTYVSSEQRPPSATRTTFGIGTRLYLGLTLAFAVAVFVRFYRLSDIPSTLVAAEATFRDTALRVQGGSWVGLWLESVDGQPTGYAYLTAGWTYLFGDGTAGLRLVSAAIGIATMVVLFLFCRSLFGRRAALLGALLMAFSVWHITYSRLALPEVFLPLAALAVVWTLLRALDKDVSPVTQRRLLVLSGILLGAGFYLHNAFVVFAVVVLLLWTRELLAGRLPLKALLQKGIVFLAPALLVLLPYLGFLAGDSVAVVSHFQGLAVFQAPEFQALDGVPDRSRYVLTGIGDSARVLFSSIEEQVGGSGDTRRLLGPVTGFLAGLGLVVGVWRIRERGYAFLWITVVATLLVAGMTRGPGTNGILLLALPVVFASAGTALDWLLVWMRGRVPLTTTYVLLALLVVLIAVLNLAPYYSNPDNLARSLPVCCG